MRRSPTTVALTAVLALLGCHVHGTGGGSAPPPVAEPATPDEPAPPGEPEAPLAIGWTEILGAPDAAAEQQHRRGIAQHEAGRCEDALASFEQALAIEPDFAWARYHRARALACLGRGDEAVAELERLVLEALPTFGPRWAADEALAEARATAEGQELDARLPAIREAYRHAIATGVPAMTYHARKPRDAEGQPRIPYEDLRLGVYDPAERRFVPAVPAVPNALAGSFDRQADRALVLAGELVAGELWVVQARRLDVRVFDLADPGRVVLEAVDVDARYPETDQSRVAVEAAVEGDDARVTLRQVGYDPTSTQSVHVTTNAIELTHEHVAATSPRVHVDANGAFADVPPPAGLSLDGRTLHVPSLEHPVALGAGHDPHGHPHVARTLDGRWAIVFTEMAGCKETAFTSHVLDRVDLEHGEATRLSAAATHADVALGPDGSVYLDADGHVVRFAPGSTKPVADVLPGVRFALPDYDRDCSV